MSHWAINKQSHKNIALFIDGKQLSQELSTKRARSSFGRSVPNLQCKSSHLQFSWALDSDLDSDHSWWHLSNTMHDARVSICWHVFRWWRWLVCTVPALRFWLPPSTGAGYNFIDLIVALLGFYCFCHWTRQLYSSQPAQKAHVNTVQAWGAIYDVCTQMAMPRSQPFRNFQPCETADDPSWWTSSVARWCLESSTISQGLIKALSWHPLRYPANLAQTDQS